MNQIEEYEERKKLRRSRFRWRILAVLALLIVAGMLFTRMQPPIGPHVASFDVDGVIVSDPQRVKLLRKIGEDDEVKALVVRINSPGGTVTGSEELYESLRDIAAEKPVVAMMTDVAASGGYITALAADHIVARGSTITGSVGVIFQAPNFHELMDRVGVEMVTIKSGRLKAEPNPFEPVDPSIVAAEQELVTDSFDWFLGLVQERRDMGENALAEISEGGVFTGRMARERGLVDAIGGLEEAREWLKTEHDTGEALELVPYAIEEEAVSPLALLMGDAMFGKGMPDALARLGARLEATPRLWAIYR